MILAIIFTVCIFIVAVYTVVKSRHQAYSAIAKIERWLILQALFSGILIIASYILAYIGVLINSDTASTEIFFAFSFALYNLHTYFTIILHFIFSPEFRKAFIRFYANLMFHRKKLINVTVVGPCTIRRNDNS